MAEEKAHALVAQTTPYHVPTNEVEEETDAVLLDLGAAKLESGAYGSLKLAKDGHVWTFLTVI